MLGDSVRGGDNGGGGGHCDFQGVYGVVTALWTFLRLQPASRPSGKLYADAKNCEIRTQEATEQLLFGIFL